MSELEIPHRSLRDLESVIERGLASFINVGEALMEIRDGRLYLQSHNDFDSYCRERWGFSRVRSTQIITASRIAGELVTQVTTPPSNEKQVRELAHLTSERRADVWQEIVQEHGPEATAKQVREVVQARTFRPDPKPSNVRAMPTYLVPSEPEPDIENIIDVDELAVDRLRVQFSREFKHLGELIQLQPDAIAAAMEPERLPSVRMRFNDARLWMDAVEHALRPQGIRIIS